MKLNLSTRTQAMVLLLLVATSGALAGVMGDRLLLDRGDARVAAPPAGAPADGPWRWEARPDERYGQRLANTLELSEEQRAAIDSIVEDQQDRVQALAQEIQPRFRALAEETRSSIEEVLDAEQRERLRSLREQRMRAMRPGMRQMVRPGMREDGAGPMGPRGPGGRGAEPGLRSGPAAERLPPEVRDALRDGRMWEYLDSVRGDRPLWQVRDSLLRERGDTAAAERLRERRDSLAAERRATRQRGR
jgi:Spy/CpxP family protein refolding chaperone